MFEKITKFLSGSTSPKKTTETKEENISYEQLSDGRVRINLEDSNSVIVRPFSLEFLEHVKQSYKKANKTKSISTSSAKKTLETTNT